VRFDGDDDQTTFLLGAREVLSLDGSVDVDVYSPQSPLGAAIIGKRTGDSASYKAPNGRVVTLEVVDAKPYVG
jgi:transcription elongation factor GreA